MRFYYDLSLVILILVGLIGVIKVLTYWFALHIHTNLHRGKEAEKETRRKAIEADVNAYKYCNWIDARSLPESMLEITPEYDLTSEIDDLKGSENGSRLR